MDAVRRDGIDDLDLLEDPQGRVAAPDREVDHERRLEHAFGGLGHVLRVGVLRKELIQADADQGDDEEPGGCGALGCDQIDVRQPRLAADACFQSENKFLPIQITTEK